MTHAYLVDQIRIIKDREKDPHLLEFMKAQLLKNTSSDKFMKAVRLLEKGIRIFQENNDFDSALKLIEESISTFKTPEAYFNKGTIYYFGDNMYECFRAQTSAILLAGLDEPVVKSFEIRAISLYEMYKESSPTTEEDKNIIIDFIISDLKKAIALGEKHCEKMLSDMYKLK